MDASDEEESRDEDNFRVAEPKIREVKKSEVKKEEEHAEHEEYDELIHPNLENEEEEARAITYLMPNGAEPGSWADSAFVKWFATFDELKLRPFLIRNYDVVTALIEDQYQELLEENFDDHDETKVLERVQLVKRTMSTL